MSPDLLPAEAGVMMLRAALVFGFTLGLYLFTAWRIDNLSSPRLSYFDHLAAAWLKRQLHLARPPAVHDLTFHNGRWYVPFPPLPALLLLPWVALRGVERTSTPIASCLTAAVGVTAFDLAVQELGRLGLTHGWESVWLSLLFACGSVFWWLSVAGAVWCFGQVAAATFLALATWSALAFASPWPAGLALGLAMLGRPHLALAFPLLVGAQAERLRALSGQVTVEALLPWVVAAALPAFAAVALLLLYNRARFGSWRDFGYQSELVAAELGRELQRGGQFGLRFLGRNLWYMLLAPPRWQASSRRLRPDPYGTSLLLTSPALWLLLGGWPAAAVGGFLLKGAVLAVVLVALPILTYYATGWWQFGSRFSLDFQVPLFLLIALAEPSRGPLLWLLVAASVGIQLWGLLWFYDPQNAPPGGSPIAKALSVPASRSRASAAAVASLVRPHERPSR